MPSSSRMQRLAGVVSRRERGVQVVAGVMAGLLIAGSIGAGLHGDRSATREAVDGDLRAQATSQAGALNTFVTRERSLDLLLAHDSAIRTVTDDLAAGQTPTPELTAQVDQSLAYLEHLFPGSIEQASMIDRSGTEVGRVVRGHIAPASDLSHAEALDSFFTPTMSLPAGHVWQSAPYVSGDTHQWVVSASTPLSVHGTAWAMVHFEVSLRSLHPTLTRAQRRSGMSAWLVDASNGDVLMRDGHIQSSVTGGTSTLGATGSSALRAAVASGAPTATIDGRRAGIVSITPGEDSNAEWAVVVWAPATADAITVSPLPIAMIVTAFLLLLASGSLLRARSRRAQLAGMTDELTGLANRRRLAEHLPQIVASSERRGTTSALLLVDLDRFKDVNDTLGHHYGDELLRAVAQRLGSVVRTGDMVARLSGDEFAVLLPDLPDAAAAEELARRCLTELHRDFHVGEVTLDVEASIGLALLPQHGSDLHAAMRAADIAMYAAKESKLGVVSYDPARETGSPSRIEMLGELRRALAEGQLVMHYQPKVSLLDRRTHAVEALVRWHHPERGLVPPCEFIPLAESTGLMLPLTLHTLDLALAQARRWMDAGRPLQVAVNLSARCLLEPTLPAQVTDYLQRHGVPASLLRLEVTESMVMGDPTRALDVLLALRAGGIHLSIDDFGTGYSSLAYLKRLPVDELKIDRTFVMDLLAGDGDDVLVRSSIELGHNLGMSVVAEGVEDEDTVQALAALGCDSVQGYHLGRPMSAEVLATWLAAADAACAAAL